MEIFVDGSQTLDNRIRIGIQGYHEGNIVLSYVSDVPIRGDNMTAEQIALIVAMELIKDKYPTEQILLLSDQVFYVDTLNSGHFREKYFSRHEYLAYMAELFEGLKNIKLRYVKRNKNDADKLIRKKMDRAYDYHKINDCPINRYLVEVLSHCEDYKFKTIMAELV